MDMAIATLVAVAALLTILERLYAMWLCREALRTGRGFRWVRGIRPYVDIDSFDDLYGILPNADSDSPPPVTQLMAGASPRTGGPFKTAAQRLLTALERLLRRRRQTLD